MACHDAHCIGWLVNQVGPGNNIALRIRMMNCENAKEIKLRGGQHQRFEDTLAASATVCSATARGQRMSTLPRVPWFNSVGVED